MTLADILRKNRLFEPLKPSERQILEQAFCVQRHPGGFHFTDQGQPARGLYLVIEGHVELTRRPHDKLHACRRKTLRPGKVIGLVSMMDRGPATATCRARGSVTAASLPREAFTLLLSTHADIGRHFQRVIARQIQSQIHFGVRRALNAFRRFDTRVIRSHAENR